MRTGFKYDKWKAKLAYSAGLKKHNLQALPFLEKSAVIACRWVFPAQTGVKTLWHTWTQAKTAALTVKIFAVYSIRS